MRNLLIGVILMATSAMVPANESIYYLDASFSGCDAMGICNGRRTGDYLHTLATIGGQPFQMRSLSGVDGAPDDRGHRCAVR